MEFKDLKPGRVYRAKKPKLICIFDPLVNDRQILNISTCKHPVKKGKKYQFTKEYKEWFKDTEKYTSFHSYMDEIYMIKYEEATGKSCIEYDYVIQYDTPGGEGKHYPKTSVNEFLKWASQDVTNIMPKGEWANKL